MLRVLTSYQEPTDSTNPYVIQLHRALVAQPELQVRTFSLGRALGWRFSVFHLHWPEPLWSARTPARRLLKKLLLLVFLAKLSLSRAVVVQTLHNLAPHEPPDRLGRLIVAGLRRRTVLYIRLNGYLGPELPEPGVTILHGHYRDWFSRHPLPSSVPGQLLFFGLLRPYKGLTELIPAFEDSRDAAGLRICGRPTDPALAAELEALAAADQRIGLELRFLDEPELVAAIGAAGLVVLPYREMYNSGSLLAALSLDRPVLVPDSEVNRLLQAEVGPGWVHLYSELTGAVIDAALVGRPQGRPDLSGRGWAQAGPAHLEAYRRAVRRRG
jgi:Glycosyltransferase